MEESSNNRCGIKRLETLISKVEARTAHEITQDRFESFKEILNAVQEGFTAQLRVVLDKINEAENKLCGSLQEIRRSNSTDSAHGDDGEDAAIDFYPDVPCPSPGLAGQSKPIFESTPLTSKQTCLGHGKPLAKPSAKGPQKNEYSSFAGLSSYNSPERRVEEPEPKPEPAMSPTSPGRARHDSTTLYSEAIHFEPQRPLPEIEVQTGEEEEEVMFSTRTKLYRFDKDVSAWKDRGLGTMKILYNSEKGRCRILMRREVVHKVCANHLITADMKLEEKKGSTNSLIWSTPADYSEEVSKPEQLAVKFKTQDDVLLFKKTFEECQEMLKKDTKRQGNTADTREKNSDLMAKFAPKPGSWPCSVGLISNEEHLTLCAACGAAKLPERTDVTGTPFSGFHVPTDSTPSSAPDAVSSALESPFTFKMRDSGTLNSSPFTFRATNKSSPSSFTFGGPTSATSSTTSTLFSAPTEVSSSSNPATSEPFLLAAFGVPAISNNSSQPSFKFVTSSSKETSPFSFSLTGQTANVNNVWQQVTTSIFEPSNSQPESASQTPGGFSFTPQGGFLPNSMVDFSSSELLRLLAAAKQQQDSVGQTSCSGGYDFTPYVVDEPSEDIQPLHGEDQPFSSAIIEERYLGAKSPLKGAKKQDEDCVLVYEVRASIADRKKATRLLLPLNFFNYAKHDPCPGCIGCGVISKDEQRKEPEITSDTVEDATASTPDTSAGPVFGQSTSFGQLTFSSLLQNSGAFSHTQNKDSHKSFQVERTQLFSQPTEEAEGQHDDQLHVEPVISLPDEIKVVTGEEGLEVLFSERAKLYRFDADSGQWKERGIGEIKLLRHPSSGRARVLMRREQIKKLCANHNITAGMELKPNVGSDRSWVWYTSADYAEGEARPEKLAIKLKTPEIAEKFKQVFDDLKELSPSVPPLATTTTEEQKETGCELYEQFLSKFAPAPGAWSCEMCYVENKAGDSACVACSTVKHRGAQVVEPSAASKTGDEIETAENASVVESVEPITFQDSNKSAAPAGFVFQPAGGKGVCSGQLFTIGRAEPSEDTAYDYIEISSRRFTSPSKQRVTLPQNPSTPSMNAQLTGPFGTGTPFKFTFSMVVSPGSPVRQGKSPLSHASPVSPKSPIHGDDDGPLKPLAECRTGEQDQEVLVAHGSSFVTQEVPEPTLKWYQTVFIDDD